MTAAEGSFLGLAKQVGKGTPNTTDNAFKYLLFSQGSVSPQSQTLPLDPEVGGGAMLRNVLKTGVMSAGQLQFIPRPDTLGLMLLGAFGKVTSTLVGSSTGYKHTFELPADQFDAPYFTLRSAPGNLWGEQIQDARVAALSLEFRAANFVRGTVGFMGGLPAKVATTSWGALAKVDGGPQFVTAVSENKMEIPDGTAFKVLGGSFTSALNIPLDEQWLVGSYTPDAFDIVSRAFALSLIVKITDATAYTKMAYDPAGGSAWVADMYREADLDIVLASNVEAEAGVKHSLTILGNGNSGATANIPWSVAPIALRAGKQIVAEISGIFLADATLPIKVELINTTTSY